MRSAPWRLQALLLLLFPFANHVSAFVGTLPRASTAATASGRVSIITAATTVTPDMFTRTDSPFRRTAPSRWEEPLSHTSTSSGNRRESCPRSRFEEQELLDVATVFREELPALSIDKLSPQVLNQDARLVRARLQYLKTSLPGVNLATTLPKVPRLTAYYGQEAEAMERRIKETYAALVQAMHMQYVGDFIGENPKLLLRDYETRIRPYLDLLNSALPGCDGAYLVRKHPSLLAKGIFRHLRPRLQVLASIFPIKLTEENITALVSNYPELLTVPLEEITTRLQALATILPTDLLLPTLVRHPRAWTAKLEEEVGPQVKLLNERLGEETARSILLNLPSAMYHSPLALARKLDLLGSLLGSAEAAETIINSNPMILAMDTAANVAPKIRYVRSLYADMEQDKFVEMLATETGSKCLTAAFGRLGRMSYLLQIQPDLEVEKGMRLVVCSSEELRRWYPGYENFLEDRIEPRFPNYTWEQLCALPFSLREQAHGELLYNFFSNPDAWIEEEEEEEEQPFLLLQH